MKSIVLFLLKPILAPLSKLDGWKSILGYLITEGTMLLSTGNPLVEVAVRKAMEEPTFANIIMAFGQVLLAIGLLSRGIKNVASK